MQRSVTVERTRWQTFRDRALASDPGLVRLIAAGRAVLAIATALGLEFALAAVTGAPPLMPLMLGAVMAMLSAFGVLDPTRRGQAVTMFCLPLFLLAGMGLALAVDRNRTLSLATFVLVVFVAVAIRRFGPRYFVCGMVGFMGYFFALFLNLRLPQLPGLLPAVALAVVWTVVLMVLLVPIRNDRMLRRMIGSFEARLSAVADAARRLRGPDADASERVRSRLVRLNETALMIDGQLGAPRAVADDERARTLRRAVFDGELAARALVAAVEDDDAGSDGLLDALRHRDWERLETDARALTHEPTTPDALRRIAADVLILTAVRAAWTEAARSGGRPGGSGGSEFEPAVQLFGGNLPGSAGTVSRLHDPDPDAPSSSTSTSRSRPRLSLTTRQAIQAALATAAAVAVGDALSTQRYYWAVLAAFIAFTGTATVAETVSKAVHRTVGTLVGLFAAIAVVPLIGTDVAVVLPVILLAVFGAFYVFKVSYALMIFFITLMLGELYALLGSFSVQLMVLRLEETAAGGLIGCLVAVLVLPTRTRLADREARRGLLTALGDLLDAIDHRLRRRGGHDELAAAARVLDAALHQALLIGRPLGRTWMVAPNEHGRRRLTNYAALVDHARHLARGVDRDDHPRDGGPALAGACSRLRDLVGRAADDRPPAPGELAAVAALLAPVGGSDGELSPLARELGLLVGELGTLFEPAGPDDHTDDHTPSATGRVVGPDREPLAATVTLVDPVGGYDVRARTDEHGRFTVTPMAPGTHLIVVSPRDARLSAPHGEYVRVDSDVVLPDLSLRPAPARTGRERVVTADRSRMCA